MTPARRDAELAALHFAGLTYAELSRQDGRCVSVIREAVHAITLDDGVYFGDLLDIDVPNRVFRALLNEGILSVDGLRTRMPDVLAVRAGRNKGIPGIGLKAAEAIETALRRVDSAAS